jgi:agmatine deiminase
LPATYANFLVVNGAVLMPTYGDPADGRAAEALAGAFPGREVVAVPSAPLLLQHGSLHCATMQVPREVWRA